MPFEGAKWLALPGDEGNYGFDLAFQVGLGHGHESIPCAFIEKNK